MGDFSWFDIIVGLLILILAIRGIANGFIREFLSLVGIVGGVFIASVYATPFGNWISDNIYTFKNPSAISLVGFLCVLIFVWVLSLLLAEILQKIVNKNFGVLNKVFGFLFSGFKIFFIFAILAAAFHNIDITKSFIEKRTQNSKLYPLLLSAGGSIIKLNVSENKEVEVLQNNLKSVEESTQETQIF
ncbi:MAG: CvpA family protein [Helicobacter sp.]|nr:CvpA family protein [Helicobacteraceae bacterium]MDY3113638.1 CvpA family protein [Helicobacter sp.]